MEGVSEFEKAPVYLGVIGLCMTLLRLVLAFLCIPFIMTLETDWLVAILVLAIVFFDYYDGKMFRKSSLNANEKWRSARRILDSSVDRLSIQIVCIPLFIVHPSFLIPYLVICFKEITTSTICIQSYLRGYILYPSNISRLATVFVGITVIAQLLFGEAATLMCSIILLLGGLLSLRHYIIATQQFEKGLLAEGKEYEWVG